MKKLFAALLLVVLSSVSLTQGFVRAQSGGGLEISPVRGELSLKPGESGELKVSISNTVAGAITTSTKINDFNPDVNGSTLLLGDNESNTSSIKDFVGDINTATLQPKEKYDAIIPITIPQSTAPGVYYGVVRFEANPVGPAGEAQTAVTLNASVGYIVLIEVEGNLTESMSISSVLPLVGENSSNILAKSPTAFSVTVNNNGRTILKPFGTLQVFDFRNKQVASLGVNSDDVKVNSLPGVKRSIRIDGKNIKLGVGRYKVVTTLAFGKQGETIDHTSTFWVLPPFAVALFLIVVASLIAGILVVIRKARLARRR